MTRNLTIGLAQEPATSSPDVTQVAERISTLARLYPTVDLWALPELHMETAHSHRDIEQAARQITDEMLAPLSAVARRSGSWIVPGSMYERGNDGRVYNTAIVLDPDGQLVATYRKIFPWRPLETTAAGSTFQTFDIPDVGRVGLSICYDVWFPEHTRSLTWMGADLVLNVVQTNTSDRAQELAIVRGNAIMNQVWIASVNAAAPTGRGQSLLVDPEGVVRAHAVAADTEVLTAVIDMDAAARARELGTAGVTRPWSQFHPDDSPIDLPIYQGRIAPTAWQPAAKE